MTGIDRREFITSLGALGGAAALGGGLARPAAAERAADASEAAGAAAAASPTREALLELLETVRAMDATFVTPERGFDQPWELAESHRYFVHLLAAAHHFFMENDPARPRFERLEAPWRKFMGGNPDAYYFFAPLRGDRSYRVRGRHRGEVYRSLTVHGGKGEGGWGEYVISHLNDRQYRSEPDGSYELILSPEEVPGRNWIRLTPDARSLITRHYFLEEEYCPAAKGWEIPIEIEPLEEPAPRAEPSEESVAHKLRAMSDFIRDNTVVLFGPEEKLPTWFARDFNRFGKPSFWGGEEDGGGWGAVDNSYSSGRYRIAPDEAIVLTGRWPRCAFASVVLVNRWLQSYDFTQRRVSFNMRQTKLEPDGSFRIVVAHEDPGLPNWMDTGGRGEGQLDWRFQLPEEQPETPRARVVKLATLRG